MAEARLLRQHKGRLEARMQILEEHNRQLEAQLQRLRRLLDEVTDYSFSITYCKFHCQTNNLQLQIKIFYIIFYLFFYSLFKDPLRLVLALSRPGRSRRHSSLQTRRPRCITDFTTSLKLVSNIFFYFLIFKRLLTMFSYRFQVFLVTTFTEQN